MGGNPNEHVHQLDVTIVGGARGRTTHTHTLMYHNLAEALLYLRSLAHAPRPNHKYGFEDNVCNLKAQRKHA
jgi:hypothetical protein